MMPPRPRLLLLHAFGASGRSFEPLAQQLPDFDVQAPDLPGFGGAPPLPKPSIAAYVDWVAAAVPQTPSSPLILGGWSMGGKLALAACRSRDIAGLLLIAPSPPGPEPMDEADRRAQLAGRGDPGLARRSITDLTKRPLPKERLDDAVDDRLSVDPDAWRWWLEAGSREQLSSTARLEVPALVVAGDGDPNLGPAVQRRLTLPVLASGTVETIRDCGHFAPLEQPEALARIVSDRFNAWRQATPAPPVAP